MELVEFLLARVAEDEAMARDLPDNWIEPYDDGLRWHGDDMLVVNTARVLAECEAKRRIVAMADEMSRRMFRPAFVGTVALEMASEARGILRDLALPYADHPDYNPTWSAAEGAGQ